MTALQTVDALERALAEASGASDTDVIRRIDLLNALAWELSDGVPERAMALAETAFALADAPVDAGRPYRSGMAYSLRTQGYLDQRSGAHPRTMLAGDPDASIVLLTPATLQQPAYRFPPEYGESPEAHWVFRIIAPAAWPLLQWSIVDLRGERPAYSYGFG